MTTATKALTKLLEMSDVTTVLDVGSGAGHHAAVMCAAGREVFTNSLEAPADYIGDFMAMPEDRTFCAVWAAHVLEHQPNVNAFLTKCWRMLRPGGVLCVTVPPMKPEIVGGHLTLWNAGLLLYNVILAGFDCRDAKVLRYGYNISLIVRRGDAPLELPALRYDTGDIEALAPYFPGPVQQGFHGDLFNRVNWE